LSKNRRSSAILYSLLFLYSVLLLFFNSWHEPWRDELQAFLIAKESHTLADLFYNTRYEGHPSLWFLILYILKFISPSFAAVKLLHNFISILIAWILLKYSPFKLWQKVLLIFGYYLFYEYGFIIRNYALGILFIMGFCALYHLRKELRIQLILSALVFFMMISNFYSFFIGFFLFIFLSIENYSITKCKAFIIQTCIMLCGIIIFTIDTLPPEDYGYAAPWLTTFDKNEANALLQRVFLVFFPMPQVTSMFWNQSILPATLIQSLLALLFIFSVPFLLLRNSLLRVLCFGFILTILAFSYFKFNGYLRHNGHLFIGLLAFVWLDRSVTSPPGKHSENNLLFNVLLLFQFIATPVAVYCEIKYPFSQAREAASYLKNKFGNSIIVAHEDAAASAVAALLDKPLFYSCANRFGTYILWDQKRLESTVTTEVLLRQADSLQVKLSAPVVFLFNTEPDSSQFIPVKIFRGAAEPAEQFFICVPKKAR
jgi:hypothetical protein